MGLDSYNPTVTARLRNASKTRILNLSESYLRSVPQEIESIKNLRNLNLSINQLVEIPSFLGGFDQLKNLNLSRNQLERIPDEIGNLVNLEVLIINQNKLTEFPDSLERCSSLKSLEASENNFSIFPKSICALPNLESLDLSNNRIAILPDEIGNLKALSVNIQKNRLTFLNSEILKNCERLRVLNVDENQLSSDEIENCLLNIPSTLKMSFERNVSRVHTSDLQEMGNDSSRPIGERARKIIGKSGPSNSTVTKHLEMAAKSRVFQMKSADMKEFPEALLQLGDTLRNIELSDNTIRRLPSCIGQFSELRMLHLSDNCIEHVPDEIGNLKKLEVLNLASNRLTKLPATIAGCVALKKIDVSFNSFSEFPLEVIGIFQLEILNISGNTIESLPDEISELKVLELLLNKNYLSSLNSVNLSKCPRLRTLRIDDNFLEKKEITRELLEDSGVNLITIDGNMMKEKDLQDIDGYEAYQERLTATKRKI